MTTVAIVPWGDCIEDFLEPLGLDAAGLANDLSEGWLFGYVKALAEVDIASEIIAVAAGVDRPQLLHHGATGAPVHLVPQSRLHRLLRRRLGDSAGRQWVGPASRRNLTTAQKYAALPLRPVRRLLRERSIDALLVQEYEYPRFDLAVAAFGRSTPVYGVYQGADTTHTAIERRLRPLAMRRAAGLITPSAGEVERVRAAHGDAVAVHVVANPIDTDLWASAAGAADRAELALDADECVFVCHGRIDVARKGIDVLLDAWERHCGTRTVATTLVLIGSGQDDAELRARLRNRPVASVRWLDTYETSRAVMARWLGVADAYVSASRLEGMPVAPLEAMACGTGLIVSDAPGLRDIVGPGDAHGCRFASGDADALAGLLTELSADRGRLTAMGDAARRHVVARYGLAPVGRALARALEGQSNTATDAR